LGPRPYIKELCLRCVKERMIVSKEVKKSAKLEIDALRCWTKKGNEKKQLLAFAMAGSNNQRRMIQYHYKALSDIQKGCGRCVKRTCLYEMEYVVLSQNAEV